ncbi:MAG TPA: hypothetical protein VHG51_08490 [Longimicrobiaceae bacterium]|nr:hypothetical protein [Longimicrobiaceae bacterium]
MGLAIRGGDWRQGGRSFQRLVEVFRHGDLPSRAAELAGTWLGAADRDDPRDRLTVLGQDDFLTAGHLVDEFCEVRLRLPQLD